MNPIVFDKFETTYKGYGQAILQNAKDVRVYERINGEKNLDLVLPRNDEKWQYIETDTFIKVEDEVFIIRSTDEIKDETGKLMSNIQCEHILFELLDEYIYDDVNDLNAKEYIGKSAQFMLDNFLEGTRFKADASRLSGLRDLWLENATPIKAINEMCKLWECEFICNGVPDDDGKFLIIFHNQIGNSNSNTQFRYKKNIKSIRKTTDARDVVTRLYVYGEDGLGIHGASQNTTDTAYIDSQYLNSYPRPKKGYKYFKDIDDQDELYAEGQKYLESVEIPRITYEVSVAELKKISQFKTEYESFSLGDNIRIIDDEINADVFARIVEYERFPYEPKRSSVKLANFDIEFEELFKELNNAKRTVDRTTTSRGDVNTTFLSGVINALQNRIEASGDYLNAEVRENEGILFENNNQSSTDYGALYIGPNIMAIADQKDSYGRWIYRTFGTGSGFIADEIKTGTLDASIVNVDNLNASNIKTGTLDANVVNVINVIAEAVRTKSGSTLLSEVYKDTNGGVMKIYDSYGNLNAKIGVEGGGGGNEGGTLILYDDSSTRKRIEMGISRASNSGVIIMRDSQNRQKIHFASDNDGTSGSLSAPIMGILDDNGYFQTYFKETEGYINKKRIATEEWVQQQIDAAISNHESTMPHSDGSST